VKKVRVHIYRMSPALSVVSPPPMTVVPITVKACCEREPNEMECEATRKIVGLVCSSLREGHIECTVCC